jgi:histidine ammonia-lyase
MLGMGSLCLHDAYELLKTEEAALALSLEAITGWIDPLDPRIHNLRPHPGQILVAQHVRRLLKNSNLVRDSSTGISQKNVRPQDPYSFRCAPQVLGASLDALDYSKRVFEIEMNSATDNPLLFPNEQIVLSGGNFHGQPVSMALDIMTLALSNMANISERRTSALLDPTLNNGLPSFLVGKKSKLGVSSGLMAVQYTAAALVAENKILTHPASSDSIPTSSNFEDFVSMGPGAASKAVQVLKNSQYVISIELFTAAQAVSLRKSDQLGKGTSEIYRLIRQHVPTLDEDRSTHEDLERIRELVRDGKIARIVEKNAYQRIRS